MVASATLVGLDATIIHVEVDVSPHGLPYTKIVGLPARVVQESKERVRSAIRNSGVILSPRKTTVNLSPAALPKQQSFFDLPIALGILQGHGKIPIVPGRTIVVGELSLDGSLVRIRGALAIALRAKVEHFTEIVLPAANAQELGTIDGVKVRPANSLREVIDFLTGNRGLFYRPIETEASSASKSEFEKAIFPRGNLIAKRAIQISLAGNHHLLLYGAPGTGKTMIASSVPHLLQPLDPQEQSEVTLIQTAAGKLRGKAAVLPPFRAPHHSLGEQELLGGGALHTPGEITLAHRGYLFLDEFSEYGSRSLNALRQPLERGSITLDYRGSVFTYPSRFTLIAATNLCPCGHFGSRLKNCTCSASEISRYRKKISGPLLDRIDMQIQMDEFNSSEALYDHIDSTFVEMITHAKQAQRLRYKNAHLKSNGELSAASAQTYCTLDTTAKTLLKLGANRLGLSMRKYVIVIRVAQTIADLAASKTIKKRHIAEALQLCRNLSFQTGEQKA